MNRLDKLIRYFNKQNLNTSLVTMNQIKKQNMQLGK